MSHFEFSGKFHDLLAMVAASLGLAAMSIPEAEAWLRLLLGGATFVFVLLGIALRARQFVRPEGKPGEPSGDD